MNDETKKYLSSFGKNLYSIRTNLSFTLDEISQLSLIDRDKLKNIEAGDGNPSLTTLISLARAYNVNLFELFLPPDVKWKAKQAQVPNLAKTQKQSNAQIEFRFL